MKIPKNKKIYFASDQHFGAPTLEASKVREKIFLNWLDEIEKDAFVLFLLGDLFDFWFEYKLVVPKGFVRVLGKLAHLADNGIKIHYFVGNHDLWMRNYLFLASMLSSCIILGFFFAIITMPLYEGVAVGNGIDEPSPFGIPANIFLFLFLGCLHILSFFFLFKIDIVKKEE